LMVLVFALKHFIYFETARISMNEPMTVETVIANNPLIRELYSSIGLKLLALLKDNREVISQSEIIKILFELSQKKVIQPFFVNDATIRSFFASLNYEELSKSNAQDFLSLGHVFHNMCVFINLPNKYVESYTQVLKANFLKHEDTP